MTYMIINEDDPNCWNNRLEYSDSDVCSCGNKQQHWLNFCSESGGEVNPLIWPTKCSVWICEQKPTLGGHIVPCQGIGGVVYIVPMCVTCNNNIPLGIDIELKIGTIAVKADPSETCAPYG